MRAVLAATLAVLMCAAPRAASAQPTSEASPEERQAARALADKGLELFEAGRWAEALDRFQRAETVLHAPTHLLYMARAEARLGRLLAARKLYERLAGEALPASAPKAFVQARGEAESELSLLLEDIPTLHVEARHADGRPVTVEVDGSAARQAPLALDPGTHTVVVRAADEAPTQRTVELSRGARERIEIVIGAPAPAPVIEAAAPAPSHGSNPLLVPALIAFGAAGVGAALGIGFGVAAAGEADELDALCPQNPCSSAHRDVYDSAQGLATASTISFVVTGVAAAGGVALYLVGARRARAEERAATSRPRPSPMAWAMPLPGGAALGARASW
jgi:hypothetical protein